MSTVASDNLVLNIDFLVDNAMKALDILEKQIGRFGSTLQRLSPRKLYSITDALEQTYGTTVDGTAAMGRAIDRTIGNFDKLGSKQPFDLASMGIDDMSKKTQKMGASEKILAQVEKDMNKQRIQGLQTLDRLDKSMSKAGSGFRRMNMESFMFGMSVLFFSMALKRFAETLLKDLSKVFMTLADEQNAGVKRTLELQAATQFLKFVLFDTFANTELYGMFVEFIVTAVNAISEFVQNHPALAAFIGTFLVLGVVIGGIGMVVGQLALSFFLVGKQMMQMYGIIAVVIAVVGILVWIWTSGLADVWKFALTVATVFLGVIAIMAILGAKVGWVGGMFAWLAKNPVFWLLLAILAIANAVDNLGGGWKGLWNYLKAAYGGWMELNIMVGAAIWNILIEPIQYLISLLAKLSKAVGLEGVASQLNGAVQGMQRFQDAINKNAALEIARIDDKFGMNKMRGEYNLPTDAAALAKKLFLEKPNPGVATDNVSSSTNTNMFGVPNAPMSYAKEASLSYGGMPVDTSGTGEAELAATKLATEGVARTDTSSKLQEMTDKQKEGNDLLADMKKGLENVNFSEDGVSKMSKATGMEVSKQTVQELLNNMLTVSSTEM